MTMKHIEVSRKIDLSRDVAAADLKKTLLERLEKAMDVETVTDGASHFTLTGTTGAPAGITRHARLDLDVEIMSDAKAARVIVAGYSRMARSQAILYTLAFFLVLLTGLLPGFIDTGYEDSDAGDMLVLLILGIYMVVDVNRKLAEPREFLEATLQSLATTYG